jgi:hypothetical protein
VQPPTFGVDLLNIDGHRPPIIGGSRTRSEVIRGRATLVLVVGQVEQLISDIDPSRAGMDDCGLHGVDDQQLGKHVRARHVIGSFLSMLLQDC